MSWDREAQVSPISTKKFHPNSILISGGQTTVANLFYNMGRKTVGLVGLWDCIAFDEVAGIKFKDKDGIQIMKDYMASGSFARGKEEKAATASMVFVGNINQSVDVLLKTSSLFAPFPSEMGTDTAFLDRHALLSSRLGDSEVSDRSILPMTMVLSVIIWQSLSGNCGRNSMVMRLDHYFRLGRNLNQRDTIAVRRMVDGYLKLMYPDGEFTKEELEEVIADCLGNASPRQRTAEKTGRYGILRCELLLY